MFRDPDLRRFWSRFGVIFEKRCENVTIRQSAVSGGRMGTDRRVWSGVGAKVGYYLKQLCEWLGPERMSTHTHTVHSCSAGRSPMAGWVGLHSLEWILNTHPTPSPFPCIIWHHRWSQGIHFDVDPRGTAGIITGCARNLRSGNVIVFGWPDPTHPIVGVPDQDYVQEFTPGCKEVLRTPALQGVI